MAIDFSKVQQDVASKAEPIPAAAIKTAQSIKKGSPATSQAPAKEEETKTSKIDTRRYTRVGFDLDVWQAMKVKKLMNDENFTDQINNAMRAYLDLKKQ